MRIDDRLRRLATAIDRELEEVDVAQRLGQLQGRQRRQARVAVAVALVLAVAVAALLAGPWLRQRSEPVIRPVPRLGRVVAIIPFSARPTGHGNGSVWVVDGAGRVGRVDPATNQLVAVVRTATSVVRTTTGRMDIPPARVALGVGATWVSNFFDGAVARVDPATNRVVARIPVDPGPAGIGVAGGAVWVASSRKATVLRIDPATNTVAATVRVGPSYPEVRGLATGYGGVWVANRDGTVMRIDPATNTVVATIAVASCCWGDLVAGVGAVWVANRLTDEVVRIDPATNRVVATIRVGREVVGIGIAGGAVWALNHNGDASTLMRIDPASNRVVATIPVGEDSRGDLTTGGGAIWVPSVASQALYRIDPNS